MKRISEDALTRVALSKGAVLEFGGRVLNPTSERVDVPRIAPPRPAAIQPPQPPTPQPTQAIDTASIERVMTAGQKGTSDLLLAVRALLQEVREQRAASPAPITGWNFIAERDHDHRLVIRAVAIRA